MPEIKTTGYPHAEIAREKRFFVRCNEEEKAQLRKRAKQQGMTISQYIRYCCGLTPETS